MFWTAEKNNFYEQWKIIGHFSLLSRHEPFILGNKALDDRKHFLNSDG
jgi:hypothetical protein